MFSFRPLQRCDYLLISAWLTAPQVARWWDSDPAMAAIEREYGGCIDGIEPSYPFIACREGMPLGLIQRYRFGAYPQYIDELAAIMPVAPEATSIDYFIGPPDALGRGWGAAMIRAFVQKVWLDDATTPSIIVPTHADNLASWRSLERAGFVRIATGLLVPDNPMDDERHFVYRIERPADSIQGRAGRPRRRFD
jgi:aminoglycoside 6'-N-acetyltransferase